MPDVLEGTAFGQVLTSDSAGIKAASFLKSRKSPAPTHPAARSKTNAFNPTALIEHESDDLLRQMLRQDSERAIETLFRMHYAYLCQAVHKIIPDPALSEDLVQDVFFELWRKREALLINVSIRAYLRRAAINKALNYIRDQKIKQTGDYPTDDLALAAHDPADDAAQVLEYQELQQQIDAAIDQLPERCRLVFVLSRFEAFSNQDIAEELGISVKTVENQMTKAIQRLRVALKPFLSILGWGIWYLAAMSV